MYASVRSTLMRPRLCTIVYRSNNQDTAVRGDQLIVMLIAIQCGPWDNPIPITFEFFDLVVFNSSRMG